MVLLTKTIPKTIVINCIILAIYTVTGSVSSFYFPNSPFWFPTGLALGAYVLFGFRILPSIILGGFINGFIIEYGQNITPSILNPFINCCLSGIGLIAAGNILRFITIKKEIFFHVRTVFIFLSASIILGSIHGTGMGIISGFTIPSIIEKILMAIAGSIVIGPIIISMAIPRERTPLLKEISLFLTVSITSAIISIALFYFRITASGSTIIIDDLALLILPFGAVLLTLRGFTVFFFGYSILISLLHASISKPYIFINPIIENSVFIIATGSVGFIICAINAERRANANALANLNESLESLVHSRTQMLENEISDRKKYEQRLYESEIKYRTVADFTWDWEYWLGADGSFLYVSPSCERVTGYSVQEFLHDPFLYHAIVLKEEQEMFWNHFVHEMEAGSRRLIFRIVRKDGAIRWIEHYCQPVYNEDGSFAGRRGSNRDITEKKEYEIALLRTAERLVALIQTTPDGFWVLNADGSFVEVNKQYCDMSGFGRKDILKMNVSEIESDPDFNFFSYTEKLRKTGNVRYETKHRTSDRTFIDVETSVTFIPQQNMFFLFLRNVTDSKKSALALDSSQKMLQLVLNTIPQRVFWKDINHSYVGCNKAFARDAGFQDPADVIGKNDTDMSWSINADTYCKDDINVLTSKIPHLGYEETLKLSDNSQIWIRTNKVPMFNAEGSAIGVLGIYEDITEFKRAEQVFQDKSDELDRFFTVALDLLCIADTQGIFRRLNHSWETTLGYTISDLNGSNFLDFVHPDDMESTLAAIKDLDSQKEVLNFENRYRCSDGSYRWLEWRSFPVGDLIYAAARDITKRKKAERDLREALTFNTAIVNSSPIGIAIYRDTGECVFVNDAASQIIEHEKDDLINSNFTSVRIWNESGVISTVKAVLNDGIHREIETFVKTSGGKPLLLDCHFTRFTLEEKPHLLLTFSDISGIKETERRCPSR